MSQEQVTEQATHKIQVSRQTKEEVGGVLYPAAGTGARMVWDTADLAVESGKTSSDVIAKLTAETTMSNGTVSSQLTYWRKATNKTLAKAASTEKAKKDAEKAEAKAKREQERADKKAAKVIEDGKKAADKLAKLQAQVAAAQAATAPTQADETTAA